MSHDDEVSGRSTIRLRTFLALVAMLAVALAVHANRVASERRERLAEGRRQVEVAAAERAAIASAYRKVHRQSRERASSLGEGLAAAERLREDYLVEHGVPMVERSGGKWGRSLMALRSEYAHALRVAEWEETMAANFEWAARHPAEPFPPTPPFPRQGWIASPVAGVGSTASGDDASDRGPDLAGRSSGKAD